MPQLPLASQPYGRPDYGLPEIQLVNMYAEPTPQGPGPFALLPRPGLKRRYVIGHGPVRGMFQASGVGGNAVYEVSGSEFFNRAVKLGDVDAGTGPARFAGSSEQIVVATGGKAYCLTVATSAFAQITDADLPAVCDVFYLAGRFYYQEQDSDRWWFSALGDATDIDGLAFETAEAKPDASVAAVAFGDEAWFFGRGSVEVFSQSGDANAPLLASPGRTWSHGCASQTSIVELDNTLFFLGADRLVYRAASVPERISTHGIEERLRKCDEIRDCSAFATVLDGHPFYVLNIKGQGTYGYDVSTRLWSRFQSYGSEEFRIGCGVYTTDSPNGATWLGDSRTGQVWKFDPSEPADHKDPVLKIAAGGLVLGGGVERCDVVALQCVRGEAADPAVHAEVEMRYSDNADVSWTKWKPRPLARKDRVFKVTWRRLGLMRAPGRIIEFRTTESLTLLGATVNEPRP